MSSNVTRLSLGAAVLLGALAELAHPAAAAHTTLFTFTGGKEGGSPVGPLAADGAGNLFGVTVAGGAAGYGVVFRLSPPAAAGQPWKETVLHSFTGYDGQYPNGGLLLGPGGILYGTTPAGGNCESVCGVAYSLAPPSAPGRGWRFSVLRRFDLLSPNGGEPNGGLVFDSRHDLLGTTRSGGARLCDCGVAFALLPPVPHPATATADIVPMWPERVLHAFRRLPDGQTPQAGMVVDSAGVAFGTTSLGGSGKCLDGSGVAVVGCGTVFSVDAAGGSEKVLYSFNTDEENQPAAPLAFGPGGSLYGTAGYAAFQVSPPSGVGGWTKRSIYRFKEGIAGTITNSGLLEDAEGRLYGTTQSSGLDGFSTVYALIPPAVSGGAWTEQTLARFGTGFTGEQPVGGVVFGLGGALYGVADNQSSGNGGIVFAVIP